MAISLNISQEIDVRVDWKKLAKDLKEKFNIDESEEDIEEFCCENEPKCLIIEVYEEEMEETHTNDLTGDITLRID